MSEDYSDEDVDLVATALMRAMHGDELPAVHPFAPSWKAAKADAHVALEALAAAGRLLPEGGTEWSVFSVRWHFADRPPIDWGGGSLEAARGARWGRANLKPVRGEIRQQRHWAGPPSVVEPVAIQGADSV